MRVEQLMHAGDLAPAVDESTLDARRHLRDVRKGLGMTCVLDGGRLAGIITDGDLRRRMIDDARLPAAAGRRRDDDAAR